MIDGRRSGNRPGNAATEDAGPKAGASRSPGWRAPTFRPPRANRGRRARAPPYFDSVDRGREPGGGGLGPVTRNLILSMKSAHMSTYETHGFEPVRRADADSRAGRAPAPRDQLSARARPAPGRSGVRRAAGDRESRAATVSSAAGSSARRGWCGSIPATSPAASSRHTSRGSRKRSLRCGAP